MLILNNMLKKVHLLIFGKVQGVFYRIETKKRADELGLSGWVRNTSDGGVEIVARGEEKSLRKLIDWCRSGPERAVVERVDVVWMDEGENELSDSKTLIGEQNQFLIVY